MKPILLQLFLLCTTLLPAQEIEWQKSLGGTATDRARAIQQTADGGYVVAGESNSNNGDVSGNHGLWDFWVVKLTNQVNLITGNIFLDSNTNNVQDAGEADLSYQKVIETNTGSIGFSNSEGDYYIVVTDSGNFSVQAEPVTHYTMTPNNHNIYFNTGQLTDSLNNFAFQSVGPVNDLCVTITPAGPFRAGFNAGYVINYKNAGTTSINNCTIVFFPHQDVNYVSSSESPVSITPDSVVWNIGLLSPFQTGIIVVTVNVNIGTPIGTVINSGAAIYPVAGDVNPVCNINFFEAFITGSYDPNDILVSRGTLFTTEFPNPPYLDYIIRFQNTGNDTAFTVKVINNIDDRLDIGSFEWVASSHDMEFDYKSHSRRFTFTFNNILLPDSNTNETESHGFVRYRIKPLSTLIAGDTIPNTAAIYFDFNQPVITNTVITEVILPTFVELVSEDINDKIILFPNPTSGELRISSGILTEEMSSIRIFNCIGQMVFEKENIAVNPDGSTLIDIRHFNKGMYFINLKSDYQLKHGKFIKE